MKLSSSPVFVRPKGLLALTALSLLGSAAGALPLADIKQAGVIRLATSGDFSPFNSNVGGNLTGFEVELGNMLAQQIGVRASWKVAPFDTILDGLNTDQYDVVLASHAITSSRLKLADFARPHYCTGGVVMARKGGPLDHLALKGKSVSWPARAARSIIWP